MSTANSTSFRAVTVLSVLLGVLVFGYGLLLVPESALGGAWIAAVGLSLLLSGAFAAERTGGRLGLSAADRRALSMAFALLAALLLVAFVVVNFASFDSGWVEGSG